MSEPPKSLLRQKKAIVIGPDADKVYQQGFFGELDKDKLELSDVEILFLLEREKICLHDEYGKLLAFPEVVALLSKDNHEMWVRYLLYSDLRRRGYIVKPGYGPKLEYRVYRRGAIVGKEPAKYLVYGIVEGKTIGLSELTSISNSAKLSKKDLILAVIDRQGEIAYYDASEITF